MRTTKPRTIQRITELIAELTEELIRTKGSIGYDSGFKRKFDGNKFGKKGNRFSKGGKSYSPSGNKARRVEGKSSGDKAACQHCDKIHSGEYSNKPCDTCGRKGHATCDCGKPSVCYSCGIEGYIKSNCPGINRTNTTDNGKGTSTTKNNNRVFVMSAEEARRMEEVTTCMFLINDTYAHILFDSGANKSFVSVSFMPPLKGILDGLDKL
jgi:hypothetical protein